MSIFLTSSPTGPFAGPDRRKVDGLDEKNGFAGLLKERWKEGSKCLMVSADPKAYEGNDQMIGFFKGALEKAGLSVEKMDLWDDRTEDFSRERLQAYDAVFLSGGHVPTEHEFFERIGLRESIKGFQGIIVGISAGTMNSAKIVYAQPELPGESEDPEYVRFFEGLGLTETMILPHYQMVKDSELDGKRLMEDITYGDSFGHQFYALPDGSFLLIEDGTETLYGEAYLISEGQIRKVCEDEEKLVVRAAL